MCGPSEILKVTMKPPSENVGYTADQLVSCGKCKKANPPDRASCLYCGGALDRSKGSYGAVKLNLRKLENWENGFNLIAVSRLSDADTASAARYLRCDEGSFEKMVAARFPFPIARLEAESEATLAVERLRELGINVRVVSDIELKIGKPCVRLRSVEFLEDGAVLTSFNTNDRTHLASAKIALIVVGRIVESKAESVERGKKERRKVLVESETSTDDVLVDIYSADSEQGWRITTKGFDFSTLGNEKSLLAAENVRMLLDRLVGIAAEPTVVDEYPDMIGLLDEVWEIERRTDFGGLKRTGVWRAGFAKVARTSNLEQFGRYSRLQRILL